MRARARRRRGRRRRGVRVRVADRRRRRRGRGRRRRREDGESAAAAEAGAAGAPPPEPTEEEKAAAAAEAEARAARKERRRKLKAEERLKAARAAALDDDDAACWGPVRSALWAVAWTGAVALCCAAAALRYSHARPDFTKKVLIGGGALELAVLMCAAYVSATCGPALLAGVDSCWVGVCCCCAGSDERGGCCAKEKEVAEAGPRPADERAPLVPAQPTAESKAVEKGEA